jgi:hypothetical protein
MAESPNEKQRIGIGLIATRAEMNTLFSLVRQNLDIRRHLLESQNKYPGSWMTVAAIIGWILSGLPARKQKIYIRSSNPLKSEKKLGGGGFLRPVWNGGWAITKPLLAAYLTKKIARKAQFPDASSIAATIRWAAAFLRGIKIERRNGNNHEYERP